ncbi:MAG TPA: serine/threonine-protein kinase [Gemmatimonadaceae bacterium]|nr:serine/threonine-protein kinase [Gemmatimonadaceae bacterium]
MTVTDRELEDFRLKHPAQIGPYKVIRILGEGGMGIVYEAAETGAVRRSVALKIVRAGLNSREVRARFDAERQALALMDHAGIAKVLQAGETPAGEPFFAMELVKGPSLTEYCDNKRLPTEERLRLFAAVCHAVQHAHQKGVIHRDLKPTNILVAEQDGRAQPKVIDFGIAKALGLQLTERTLVTHVGFALGTAAYMSPEQAESSGVDVDTRTDIYSLGVILYELLVGRLPIDPSVHGIHAFLARLASGETNAPRPSARYTNLGEHRLTIAHARNTDPDRLRRDLRGDLDWIAMKALDADRTCRYETAASMAADIERYLDDRPVIARPHTPAYRLRKFARRNRVGVAAGSVAILALLTGVVFASAGMIRAQRAEKVAAHEAEAARQVSDFLVGLFKLADPSEATGAHVTARELLDRGAQKSLIDLRQQPELQGRMMHTIGTAYLALGLYEDARRQLEQALAGRVRALGPNHLAVAETELALGDVLRSHGDVDAADRHLNRALDIRTAALGKEDPAVARVIAAIAPLRWKQGRTAEAESLYKQVLAIDEKKLASDDPILAKDYAGLGVVYWAQQKYPEAERMMRRSLDVQERRLGPNHPDLAGMLNNLGGLHWSQGRYAEALTLYQRTRGIYERTLDPSHPNVASVLNNIGETYWKMGRHADAEPLFRRALQIKEAKLKSTDPSLAITLNGLAGTLRDAGRAPEAEAAYKRALSIRVSALGAASPDVAESVKDYAQLLRSNGREAEAEALVARYAVR